MSNDSGDNLGVDKNDLSHLKHFGHWFFFFNLQVVSWTHLAGEDYAIRLRTRLLCRAKDLVSPWTLRPPHDRERKVGLYCSRLASFVKRLVFVCIAWTAGYMAATYEPIYGLSEDEVNFHFNKSLLCRMHSNCRLLLEVQPETASTNVSR